MSFVAAVGSELETMARAGKCSLRVPVPDTLKSGLEFLDMLYKDTSGLQRAVYGKLEQHLNTGNDEHITATLQNVFVNTSQLRSRIIGNSGIRSYGDYEGLKNSTYNGESCAYEVICLLVGFLPRLRSTLEFLEPKLKDFSTTGWGRPDFGDHRKKSELHNWLTKSSPAHGENELPGGYRPTHLIRNTGNSLHTSLFNLVGQSNGYLVKLCERIKKLESLYPPHKVTPPPVYPPASPRISGPLSHEQPSDVEPLRGQRGGSGEHSFYGAHDVPNGAAQSLQPKPSTPPPQPSSSAAPATGTVAAVVVAGGAAALYFNVGGIGTILKGLFGFH
ncbi:extracellular matrix-binding ebh [Babesia caballi]|uniref:Extracellular matrix-binding ebh n=1 Tax=Babesia caballi TaxID=5871 RepID=A0AAV4LNG5_BABCB|nr:extracellular matrix-binding ebh [Babesia caballi]